MKSIGTTNWLTEGCTSLYFCHTTFSQKLWSRYQISCSILTFSFLFGQWCIYILPFWSRDKLTTPHHVQCVLNLTICIYSEIQAFLNHKFDRNTDNFSFILHNKFLIHQPFNIDAIFWENAFTTLFYCSLTSHQQTRSVGGFPA